jgi:hypothetical protein
MVFVHLLLMAVIYFSKAGLMEASHAGGLVESGAQGDPLFCRSIGHFAHAGVHAGIGQEGMEGTAAGEAPQITQFGGDQRSSDRADARDSLMGVSCAKKSLWM